jgi:pyridinium-3,5-biscarboxylic acid mononucleotide synthase
MDSKRIRDILESVSTGKVSVVSAFNRLKHLPYEDLSFAKVDHHRNIRQGIPEVIFAEGKKTEDVVAIARSLYKKSCCFPSFIRDNIGKW